MIVIKINKTFREIVKPVRLAILVLSLSLNVYNFYHNTEISNRYDALHYLTNHFDESIPVAYIASCYSSSGIARNVEIFDIVKGEVVVKSKPTDLVQQEAIKYLNGITGIYTRVNAFPDKGYIIRIPIYPPAHVQNQWLNGFGIENVGEVFVLFPENENPFLLVLDESSRPFFYIFDVPTDRLLEELNFQIKPKRNEPR